MQMPTVLNSVKLVPEAQHFLIFFSRPRLERAATLGMPQNGTIYWSIAEKLERYFIDACSAPNLHRLKKCLMLSVMSCPTGAMSHIGRVSWAFLPRPATPTLSRSSSCVCPYLSPPTTINRGQASVYRNNIISTRPSGIFLVVDVRSIFCHFASRTWVIGAV